MCRFHIISIVLLALLSGELPSQTNITSDITTNTTWDVAGSPYIIQNSINVQNGVSLTIDPGVEIKFNGSFSISVFGEIKAVGTATDSIHITSNLPSPQPLDWDRILVQGVGSNASEFKFCRIEFGRVGVSLESTSGKISNSLIENCHRSGLSAATGSPTIKDNVIRNTVHEGIQVASGSPIIEGNTIYNNIDGIITDFASSIIRRNIIYDNARYGIDNRSANVQNLIAIIDHNTIDKNGDAGINCGNSNPVITNNIISNTFKVAGNCGGSGIRATSNGFPTSEFNDLWNNLGGNYCDTGNGAILSKLGDITADPKFFDSSNGDYHLQSNSPCIDAGDPNSPLDPDQTRNDMGAIFFNQIVTIPISLDIKPQSCPNPLNIRSNGVLPVAILGSENLDVSSINPARVDLAGISPIRWSIEDVSTPFLNLQNACDCTNEGADGFDDLTLKFKTQDIVASLGSVNTGKEVVLTLTAELFDGTLIEGEDCIIIKSKGFKNQKTISPGSVENLSVLQNYPNPFNPSTQIEYSIPKSSHVVLKIYNIHGQDVKTLVNEIQTPNNYVVSWDGRNENRESMPSGIYFANILAGSFSKTVRLVLVK